MEDQDDIIEQYIREKNIEKLREILILSKNKVKELEDSLNKILQYVNEKYVGELPKILELSNNKIRTLEINLKKVEEARLLQAFRIKDEEYIKKVLSEINEAQGNNEDIETFETVKTNKQIENKEQKSMKKVLKQILNNKKDDFEIKDEKIIEVVDEKKKIIEVVDEKKKNIEVEDNEEVIAYSGY